MCPFQGSGIRNLVPRVRILRETRLLPERAGFVMLFVFFFFLRQGLAIEPRLASSSKSPCSSLLPSAAIMPRWEWGDMKAGATPIHLSPHLHTAVLFLLLCPLMMPAGAPCQDASAMIFELPRHQNHKQNKPLFFIHTPALGIVSQQQTDGGTTLLSQGITRMYL